MFTLLGDIRFSYRPELTGLGGAYIDIDGADLARDPGFETAVLISIGSDARADATDEIPDTDKTRRGHWSEVLTGFNQGSKLWILGRSKIDNNTLRLAEQYVNESLAWMIEDGIVKSVETVASRGGIVQINFSTKITRPDNRSVSFKWFANWEYQTIGGLDE